MRDEKTSKILKAIGGVLIIDVKGEPKLCAMEDLKNQNSLILVHSSMLSEYLMIKKLKIMVLNGPLTVMLQVKSAIHGKQFRKYTVVLIMIGTLSLLSVNN